MLRETRSVTLEPAYKNREINGGEGVQIMGQYFILKRNKNH
jgi:hypothetical protein